MSPDDDPATRFSGTERYYAEHRPGYGEAAVEYVVDRFGVDGDATVLDLGCGAGQLTLPLAAHAGRVLGIDPNPEMLAAGRERAAAAGVETVEWVEGSDADIDAGLGPLRLRTIGRAFHWMDRDRTLDTLRRLTDPDGGVALFGDREALHRGRGEWWVVAHETVSEYLQDLPERETGEVEYEEPHAAVLERNGYRDVTEREFEVEREWTVDGVIGYVFSLSFASRATFGDDAEAFEAGLRDRLLALDPPFAEEVSVGVVSGRV
ncbi:class I SAM-dependent methyltransferase [Salinirubellus salinus]|uniref:Class I SAM-dependent methyltransferase n=1 Tax=Salinirubellus salinus TaxID=1364945 RepID=A0A9E7UCJ9_9EURY|nr:class I SAM-dependent methyltransferase [Salinirubellus salinus]UWM55909.1 class I SAM-dependent methyltransferase [Salinirubellus salinus]